MCARTITNLLNLVEVTTSCVTDSCCIDFLCIDGEKRENKIFTCSAFAIKKNMERTNIVMIHDRSMCKDICYQSQKEGGALFSYWF
mmetsp:Transcript_20999/g.41695  ORF Transcript_20999/g.41695 Transcript_20999/m.41695 type:complete len:86 (-) Transcript_20999:905-1162(-)